MKRIFFAACAVGALTAGSAGAADLPARVSMQTQPRAGCAQFGGWYLGANAGWAYYDHQWTDRDGWAADSDTQLPQTVRSTNSGFIGGGQAGYNYQMGCTVFGIEADYSWSNITNQTFNTDSDAGAGLDTLRTSSAMRGIGTLRARTGVVVDNLLLYVTGGVAFANFNRSYTLTDNIGGVFVSETFSSSQNKWGWVAGVGTEWALGNNWSLKSEALYVHFEDDQKSFTSALNGAPARRFDHVDNVWMARVGVNYRFGG
jgi:outer membrane immunogenic protein